MVTAASPTANSPPACKRQAAALLALGVQPGDRVAVLAPNGAMALEAHFAPMSIGAVLVMLNTRLAAGELAWILNHCGAKVLLVDPQLAPLVAGAAVNTSSTTTRLS